MSVVSTPLSSPLVFVYVKYNPISGIGSLLWGGQGCCGKSDSSGGVNDDEIGMQGSYHQNIVVVVAAGGFGTYRADEADIDMEIGMTTDECNRGDRKTV